MNVTHRGIQKRLLEVPMLQALPHDSRLSFCMTLWWLGEVHERAYGEVLYREGESGANSGCALLDGAVEVQRRGHHPIEVDAPDILGELMQLEAAAVRSATVTIVERSLVLEFEWHDFVTVSKQLLDDASQRALKESINAIAEKRRRELEASA